MRNFRKSLRLFTYRVFSVCIIYIAICSVSNVSMYAQEKITAEAKITSVTILSDYTRVIREYQADLAVGTYRIIFDKIPATMVDEFVRVKCTGGAIVQNTSIERIDKKLTNKDSVRSAQAIDSIKQQLKQIGGQLYISRTKMDFLNAQRKVAEDQFNLKVLQNQFSKPEFTQTLRYLDSAYGAAMENDRILLSKKLFLDNRLDTLKKEFDRKENGLKESYKQIVSTVEVKKAGKITLQPSYCVSNTGWFPQYEVRIQTDAKKADIVFRGLISQTTGEAWENVQIGVSLKSSADDLELPKLNEWILDYASQYQGSQSVSWGNSALTSGDLNNTYIIKGVHSIPSNTETYAITIDSLTIPVEFALSAIPKKVPSVFRSGKISNSSDNNWAPGDLNLFVDNEFISRTEMPPIRTGDTLTLSMGTEDRIRIERKLKNRFVETGGLFSAKRKVNYEYEISITNNLSTAAQLTVYDQFPLSRDEAIEVALLKPEIDPKKFADDKKLTWNLQLQPGEKKEIPIQYYVVWPVNKPIYGIE